MTHFEVEALAADYLDATLDTGRKAQMEAHIATCAECTGMLEEARLAIAVCRSAQELEPAPWLVRRILRATSGERKPGFIERLAASLRAFLKPQIVYGVSMTVFSLSFILFAAKVNLRGVNPRELNPATWFYKANSQGHLLVARAEKFYYDLRFVYEVQSVLRELRQPRSTAPANHRRPDGTSQADPPEGIQLADALGRKSSLAVQCPRSSAVAVYSSSVRGPYGMGGDLIPQAQIISPEYATISGFTPAWARSKGA